MNYTYFNTGDKAKTIYLIVYAGTADYYSDHITLVVQKAGMWENACVDGNYVVEVGADKTIDLNALVDKGFIISNLVSVTSNGTYDAATQKITVDDIDNVVKYVYYENKINLELQFVPYQKDDEELEETPTVKVEEEKKQDTVNGGETTVSLKVTVDGEIIGKVDETVITPEDTDATIKVTENKDVTGSVVEDVAIEVEQKVVSNDALTKSLAVVSNKNKEYENSSDNKDVKITSVVATFSDDSVDANTVIDKAVIEQLKKLDVSLEISKTNNTGEVEYKWNFDKDSIDNATAVDTKITIHNDVGTNNNSYKDKEKLDKLITTPEAKSTVLAFNHNGNLPGETTVTVNLGDEYAENTDIYYYHFDKDNNKLDYVGKSKVGKNGMLPVVISHCSDYVLTDKFVETKTEDTEPEDTKPEDTKPTEPVEPEKTVSVDVKYHTHIQNYGDSQGTKKNGEMAGTKGESKRLESIWVEIDGNENLGIQYTTHCQGYGWMPWSADGEVNGTSGESKRLEAIMIQLTGEDADKYDVYYRVHAQNYGWLGWAKNGEPSGTSGESKRLEGIQIVVVPKGESFNKNMEGYESATEEPYKSSGGSSPVLGQDSTDGDKPVVPGADEPFVIYQTHVQTYGWQQWKINGDISGTTGESKRLEGINIKVSNMPYDGDIVYTTHVQNYGWQGELDDQTSWKKNGEMSGTSGESKRLEAICINLTGEMAEHYDIYYRVHAQNYGWLGWAKNGDKSGTAGQSKRLEGIQIVLVPKDGEAPGLSYKGITTDVDDAFIEK
ncbi:MAG: hypothetical protein J6A59_12460 [Lachnospiraceae bacterium]|nr:hypothetical protein [Lachnospiraceae bacterium]